MRIVLSLLFSCILTLGSLVTPVLAQVAPMVVDLDVKPGSDVNPINVKSKGRTEFAILGSALFDPATVDPASLKLEDGVAEQCLPFDVNGDGFADLACQVPTHDMGVVCGETEVLLTGALLDGTPLEGSDTIKTVGCKKPKPPTPPKPPKAPKAPKPTE